MRAIPILLIIFGVLLRFLPHPANVAPVAAVALFGGAYLNRRWSIILPLAIMVLSDGLMSLAPLRSLLPWGAGSAGFHLHAPFVWLSFALVGLIGWQLQKRRNVPRVIGASLFGSVVFFLVTNWAVWAFGTMYQPGIRGLVDSYVAGLPFFRNTLVGDLGYVTVLFGFYEAARWFARMEARRRAVITR